MVICELLAFHNIVQISPHEVGHQVPRNKRKGGQGEPPGNTLFSHERQLLSKLAFPQGLNEALLHMEQDIRITDHYGDILPVPHTLLNNVFSCSIQMTKRQLHLRLLFSFHNRSSTKKYLK